MVDKSYDLNDSMCVWLSAQGGAVIPCHSPRSPMLLPCWLCVQIRPTRSNNTHPSCAIQYHVTSQTCVWQSWMLCNNLLGSNCSFWVCQSLKCILDPFIPLLYGPVICCQQTTNIKLANVSCLDQEANLCYIKFTQKSGTLSSMCKEWEFIYLSRE